MKEIVEQLEKWRKDRNINNEIDKNVELANIFEELAEYYRATNDYEKIDAICDISVFCFNWLGKSFTKKQTNEALLYLEIVNKDIAYLNFNYMFHLVHCVADNIPTQKYPIEDVITYCIGEVKRLGYDYKACMFETIKEISSRQQDPKQAKEWLENGASGKWLKDKNQPKETLYKADYEKCKLGEIK